MTYKWIFKSLTSKSINAGETGFASVQPNYPDIFNWTIMNKISYNTIANGPLIITFNKPVLISKYRILTKKGLRYPKGWNISVSYDEEKFNTVDARIEDLCKVSDSNDGRIDCGETTDRKFTIPKMTIRKIMLNLTIPGSCNTYDLHICAFDVYGTTKINEQCTCKCKRKSYTCFVVVFFVINY